MEQTKTILSICESLLTKHNIADITLTISYDIPMGAFIPESKTIELNPVGILNLTLHDYTLEDATKSVLAHELGHYIDGATYIKQNDDLETLYILEERAYEFGYNFLQNENKGVHECYNFLNENNLNMIKSKIEKYIQRKITQNSSTVDMELFILENDLDHLIPENYTKEMLWSIIVNHIEKVA